MCCSNIYCCTTVSKESTSPFEITKQLYSEEKKILFEIDSRIYFYTKKKNERFQLAGLRDVKLISCLIPSLPLSPGNYTAQSHSFEWSFTAYSKLPLS